MRARWVGVLLVALTGTGCKDGSAGATGPAGPTGPSNAYSRDDAPPSSPLTSAWTTLVSLSLGPGGYVVLASVTLDWSGCPLGSWAAACTLMKYGVAIPDGWNLWSKSVTVTLSLNTTYDVFLSYPVVVSPADALPATVGLECRALQAGGTIHAGSRATITAIQVATVTSQNP